MLKKNIFQDFSALLVGAILFLLIQPYFVWSLPVQVKLALQAIPVLLIFINNDFKKDKTILFFVLFLVLFIFSCFNQGLSFAFSLYTISFAVFFFADRGYAYDVYTWLRRILSAVLAISLMVWVLVLCGVSIPYNVIEPLNSLKPYDYAQYPLLVIGNTLEDFYRFSGPFDEPGVMGTICAMILFIEGYNLKNLVNIPLFIAGLCTLSMYFIAASLIFLGIKIIKKPGQILIALMSFMIVFYFTKDIDVFQDFVYERFEYDKSTGTFAGDNRATSDFVQYYNNIKGTSTYFWGADKTIVDRYSGSAGYRNAVLRYGFVFCFIYIIMFFFYARAQGLKGNSMLVFALLFLSVLYQRPGFLDPVYIFLFAEFIKTHTKEKKRGLFNIV